MFVEMVEANLQRLPTPRGTSIFKRILITGAGGFVGSYLCAALAADDPAVRVIATSFSGGAHVAALDLTDAAAVDAAIAREQPDAVVHLAAQASVGASQAAAAQTWAINLGGTLNLALAVARRVPQP